MPIKVPIFNELDTLDAQNALREAKQQGISGLPDKVDPVYHWVYRPEMQFSVYKLLNQTLLLSNEENDTRVIDLTEELDDDTDLLALLLDDELQAIELIYNIFANESDPLAPFGPDRELILAIGGEEILATTTEGGLAEFLQIKHLKELASEDYLTISLSLNNDSFNTLWEWTLATDYLDVAVDLNRDGILEYTDFEYKEDSELKGCGALNSSGETPEPTDKTTPTRPFRFWVNNDYDIVNHNGSNLPDAISCEGLQPATGNQVCEIWDGDPVPNSETNTASAYLDRIENYRDLEDFVPLVISFNEVAKQKLISGEYSLSMQVKGVGINIFRGEWKDTDNNKAHDYIYKQDKTDAQIKAANKSDGHVFHLPKDGASKNISTSYIEKYFDEAELKFVFEGTEASNSACANNADSCYLHVKIIDIDSSIVSEEKVYLDLHDVKDYYELATAGTAQPTGHNGATSFEAEYNNEPIETSQENTENLPIYDCVAKDEVINRTRAIQIHGWRMLDQEKIGFAETGFKRLYWSGYQGRYSAVTWPTGWHEKPAHVYSLPQVLYYLEGNYQNYNNSESVARGVGGSLMPWLLTKKAQISKLFVIAHSMGNVVVSEALRQSPGILLDGYAATNSATVSGAYNQAIENNNLVTDFKWRALNADSNPPDDFDLPPDMYRYNLIQNEMVHHGPTDESVMLNSAQGSAAYYTGVGQKVGTFINYHNGEDVALSGWELNQLTKPDFRDGNEWEYVNFNICWYGAGGSLKGLLAGCTKDNDLPEVDSRFFVREDMGPRELIWQPDVPITVDTSDILAHIIPARNLALGQGPIVSPELDGNVALELTSSNFDHSFAFHGYLADSKPRDLYWQDVMLRTFRFPTNSDNYSGLKR